MLRTRTLRPPASRTRSSNWALACLGALAVGLFAPSAHAQTPDFSAVFSLGDSLLDDPGGRRSPLIPEHVTARLGVPLTQLARGGATTATLLSQHQHTRAVEQGASFAFVWIGGNDFLANQAQISAGNFAFLDAAQANLETALDTLLEGGVDDIVFFNLADLSVVPAVLSGVAGLPEAVRGPILANFRTASQMWTQRLQAVADARDILLVDTFALAELMAAMPDAFTVLGGQLPIPAPDSGCRLCTFADPIHPSSLSVGFLTNLTILRMNDFYGTQIRPLGAMELDALIR